MAETNKMIPQRQVVFIQFSLDNNNNSLCVDSVLNKSNKTKLHTSGILVRFYQVSPLNNLIGIKISFSSFLVSVIFVLIFLSCPNLAVLAFPKICLPQSQLPLNHKQVYLTVRLKHCPPRHEAYNNNKNNSRLHSVPPKQSTGMWIQYYPPT